jgi:hypothetical protein
MINKFSIVYAGHVHLSNSMGTPKDVVLEQLAWLGTEVMPAFMAR